MQEHSAMKFLKATLLQLLLTLTATTFTICGRVGPHETSGILLVQDYFLIFKYFIAFSFFVRFLFLLCMKTNILLLMGMSGHKYPTARKSLKAP